MTLIEKEGLHFKNAELHHIYEREFKYADSDESDYHYDPNNVGDYIDINNHYMIQIVLMIIQIITNK